MTMRTAHELSIPAQAHAVPSLDKLVRALAQALAARTLEEARQASQ